jgi:gliding motility-associated-like protein
MVNEQNPIDELFRNGLKDGGMTPPPGVWEAVSAGLPGTAPGLFTLAVKSVWTWVAIGAIGIGGSLAVLSSDKDEVEVQTPKTTESKPGAEKVNAEVESGNETANQAVSKQAEQAETQQQTVIQQPNPANNSIHAEGNKLSEAVTGNNQSVQVEQHQEKQTQKLVVEEHNAAVNAPCGRNMRINATKAGADNNWTFSLNGVQAESYLSWNFGDGETVSGNPAQHIYPDLNAEYDVKVMVFRAAGCIDSGVYKVVTRQRHQGLSIPDVFTPNGDGFNDELVITLPDVEQFNLIVTDRYGKQVFVSNNPALRWNGKCAAVECPSGNYRVTITYKRPLSKQPVSYTKTILLNR